MTKIELIVSKVYFEIKYLIITRIVQKLDSAFWNYDGATVSILLKSPFCLFVYIP